jgi:hypothetical protein
MDYISRKEWGARRSRGVTSSIQKRIRGIDVHQEITGAHDHDRQCRQAVRALQAKHVKDGSNDLQHSWVVCEHGKVFEGRGWEKRTASGNPYLHSVCYMGQNLNPAGGEGLRKVIEQARSYGRRLVGHCVSDEIQQWLDAGLPELQPEPAPEPESNEPPLNTIAEVLEWVGEDTERAAAAYEAEVNGRNRATLLSALEKLTQ